MSDAHPNAKYVTLDGTKYMTIPFGADRQLDLLPGVLRLMSGPFGTIIETIKGLGSGPLADLLKNRQPGEKITAKDIDIPTVLGALKGDVMATALVGLANQLDNGGKAVIKDLLANTYAFKGPARSDGLLNCKDDFDEAFASNLHRMFRVVLWSVQVNYAPFLPSVFGK